MNKHIDLTLSEILLGLTGHTPGGSKVASTSISQVVVDSRQALPGAMFVALPGKHTDGHDYVADAFQRGAIVALIHRPVQGDWVTIDATGPLPQDLGEIQMPLCIKVTNTLSALQQLATYWRGKFSVRVVGITGSVGKTMTKELTWAVLSRRFSTLKSPGNLNNEIGLPLTLLQLRPMHERVVLEMGMYNLGEIAQLCTIARPHVGVVTNVGPTHLERLGSIERIAEAKAELIQALPPGGVAVLNYDDPLVRAMAERVATGVRVFYYGLAQEADLWASDILSEGWEGIRFVLHYGREVIHVKVPLLGRHSVHTALCATAVGLIEGMHWEEILPGLQNSGVQLRLVSVPGINGSIILDDTYNASPVSTIAALNLLDDLVTSGRKIAVLGDMAELGDFTEAGHRKVGCRVVTTASLLVTVGTLARFIADEAHACGMPAQAIIQAATNQEAITHLRQLVQPGDIILVKGSRSMAMEEIVEALQGAKGGD
ncbi:MAG: UDP-N-acetylmuramoyl-tripeptide--D-alanyl-D-alanine ligase [Anaerolineae bacterium]